MRPRHETGQDDSRRQTGRGADDKPLESHVATELHQASAHTCNSAPVSTKTSRSSKAAARLNIHFSEAAGLRHLHVGGSAIQSAMHIDAPHDLALAYTRAMMAGLLFCPEPRDMVLIGLGGGSLAKWIHRNLPRAHVAALEVDTRVVRAAHKMFHLPLGKKRLRVIVGDGADYVNSNPGRADMILLDAFVNHRQAPSIRTADFYHAARRALKRDGVLVINFMSDDPGLRAYLKRLAIAFQGRIACLRAIGEDNLIVFAFAEDPGVITPASLVGRAIALQLRYGLEFRMFAERIRSPHFVRVDGRALITKRELTRFGSPVRQRSEALPDRMRVSQRVASAIPPRINTSATTAPGRTGSSSSSAPKLKATTGLK